MSGIKSFKQSTKYQETHDEVARVGSTQLDKAWKKSGFRVANFSLNTFRWFTISEVSSENCRLAADGSKNNTTIQFLHSPFHLWISKGWFVLFLLRWGSWRIKEAGTPSGTYLPHAALRKSRSQPSLRQDSLHSHTYTEPDHSTSKDWLLSGGELREGSILSLPFFLHCKLPMKQIVKSTWKVSNLSSLRDNLHDLRLLTQEKGHRCTHLSATAGLTQEHFWALTVLPPFLLPGSHLPLRISNTKH